MTIRKGEQWGSGAPLPDDSPVAASDAEARAIVASARQSGQPIPAIGLVGGDLCRTLGGRGDTNRLRTPEAMTFPVDLGEVLLDGRLHLFVAHLVARNRLWTRAFVAMNAQWKGSWNLGPRAHPNDGLLDTFDARLPVTDLAKIRRRLPTGSHLPHPAIRQRRAPAVQVEFERPLTVFLDGEDVGPARTVSVRLSPDALSVVV